MSYIPPKGWREVPLPEALFFQEGPGLRKHQFRDAGIPFLNIRTFKQGRVDRSLCQFLDPDEVSEKYQHFLLQPDDIICSSSGTIGRIATITERDLPLMLNTSVIRFRPLDESEVDRGWIRVFLQSQYFLEQARSAATGSAQSNFGPTHLKQMLFVAPPLPEQRRIVARIEEIFSRLDAGVAALRHAKAQLQRYRQSILAAAVTGKLTQEWREHQPNLNGRDDLASTLTAIAKLKLRKSRRTEGTTGHKAIAEALPQSWGLTSVDGIFDLIDYRGSNPPKSESGHRLITAKNIRKGFISDEPKTYISEKTYEKWMVRGFPRIGDILFVTEGHTMGYAAINNRDDAFALAQRTINLQPPVKLNTRFFFYFILSSYFQDLVNLNATGSAAVGLKGAKLRSLPLPFPSRAEQNRIVAEVEARTAAIDHLEADLDRQITRSNRLRQSTLASVFSGKVFRIAMATALS